MVYCHILTFFSSKTRISKYRCNDFTLQIIYRIKETFLLSSFVHSELAWLRSFCIPCQHPNPANVLPSQHFAPGIGKIHKFDKLKVSFINLKKEGCEPEILSAKV